jgi:hypothetical protein
VKPPPLNGPEPAGSIASAGPVVPAKGLQAHPSGHVQPHQDEKGLGKHPTRIVGEATRIDPIYAMPMEDRGSTFSITLSIVVVVIFIIMIAIVFFSLR